jgi:hypothetical protein
MDHYTQKQHARSKSESVQKPVTQINKAIFVQQRSLSQNRLGEDSVMSFYQQYKSSHKNSEYTDSSSAAYLSELNKQSLPPHRFRLVDFKGKQDEIDLKSYGMGNRYGRAFGQGILQSRVKRLNLSDNHLDD